MAMHIFENKKRILFLIILFIGVGIRIFQLGVMPSEVASDEAYSAYESYSLLYYGHDSFGYHNPVYLIAWGSGMNSLQSYLMMPFIWLFGMSLWTIRLPQVIVACISIPVLYLTVKRLFSEKKALMAMFLLAICPWHIMMSRWGLESNLAPGFLLFAFFFFLKGCESNKFLILSALFYGLSLYCYSTLWVYVPLVLLLQGIYAIKKKYIRFNKYLVFSVILLFVLSLPLILFTMVNSGIINEIKTPWISIPKLVAMRSDGYSITHIPQNFVNFCKRFLLQWDWVNSASIKPFGLFYQISIPFAIIGIIKFGYTLYKKQLKKYQIFIVFNFAVSFFICLIVHVNITRMNFMHIWTLLFIVTGIGYVINKYIKLRIPILLLYCCMFLAFSVYYFNIYSKTYMRGLGDSISYAKKQQKTVYIEDGINAPKVMYYSKIPTDEYINTVKYSNYPNEFLAAVSFGKYRTYTKSINNDKGIYIFKKQDVDISKYKKDKVKEFQDYYCIIIE